jgi:hypothetical protein
MQTKPAALLITLALCLAASPALGQVANRSLTAAGYWEGAVTLPATQLGVRVELTNTNGRWSGTIDIPVQGLRNFALTGVAAKGAAVSFAMPGIPGDPAFKGALSADAKTIAGNFTQGGQTVPFKLERKAIRPERPGETPAKGIPGQGLAGAWQGSLQPGVVELRLVFKVSEAPDGKLKGTMDSLDQSAKDIPVSSITFDKPAVRLELERVGGKFEGKLSADGSEIEGTWTQGGKALPLVLKRLAKAPELSRPQEPKRPYPYADEEVVVQNRKAGVKLAGTLTVPKSGGPHPAVVLITGSGAQDRDEALMGHRPFLVLADYLTRRGIAVLRMDDRGVAKSTGDFRKATTDDFVEDTLAGVAFLKQRKEINAKKIGLVGHSEGGIVAPLAAVRSADVAFIVLLAGVGVPMDQLLERQAADVARVMGGGEDIIAQNAAGQREIFRILRTERDDPAAEKAIREQVRQQLEAFTEEQRKAMGLTDAMIDSQVKLVLTPWFRHLLAYDPRPTLKKVRCPVLAINGEKDVQVAAKENLAAIQRALTAGGNRDCKTVELAGLNHLLQTCRTGAVAEYGQIEETMAPAALRAIAEWIRAKTGG